jgi:hypothetical protein
VAAARYEVTSYPTLLVLDGKGAVLVRQVGLETEKVSGWLTTQTMALRSEAELEAHVKARPDDVEALWLLARRAEARGDQAAMRSWLTRIEGADRGEGREEAAEAAWLRMESDLVEDQRRKVRAATVEYIRRYPAHADRAVRALAASGADRATLEAELARAVGAMGKDDNLNGLVYQALSAGALDAALAAAEKQAALHPEDPNAYDSLAEVHNYRGDRAKAVATAKQGLAVAGIAPELEAAMRANLARFETGGPSGDVPAPRVLASPLEPIAATLKPRDAETAARTLYTKNLPMIARQCSARKKGFDEVFVRLRVGEGKLERVEVLEPGAPAGLKKCLDQAIRSVKVPAEQEPARVTMAVKL